MISARVHVNLASVAWRSAGGAGVRGRAERQTELRRLITRAARAVLAAHEIADAELSVTLLDDAAIADLNVRFLGCAGPTDVISFPLHAAGEAPLGDVYVGYEQALRQAAELEVPPEEELARLAIHGILHVLGYGHPEGRERESSPMWQVQETILREVMGK